MPSALEGQVALVTGAASGIGLASTEALLAAGARVVLAGREAAGSAGSLLEAREVAEVILFMLTRPRGLTIRDVVMMPTNFDL